MGGSNGFNTTTLEVEWVPGDDRSAVTGSRGSHDHRHGPMVSRRGESPGACRSDSLESLSTVTASTSIDDGDLDIDLFGLLPVGPTTNDSGETPLDRKYGETVLQMAHAQQRCLSKVNRGRDLLGEALTLSGEGLTLMECREVRQQMCKLRAALIRLDRAGGEGWAEQLTRTRTSTPRPVRQPQHTPPGNQGIQNETNSDLLTSRHVVSGGEHQVRMVSPEERRAGTNINEVGYESGRVGSALHLTNTETGEDRVLPEGILVQGKSQNHTEWPPDGAGEAPLLLQSNDAGESRLAKARGDMAGLKGGKLEAVSSTIDPLDGSTGCQRAGRLFPTTLPPLPAVAARGQSHHVTGQVTRHVPLESRVHVGPNKGVLISGSADLDLRGTTENQAGCSELIVGRHEEPPTEQHCHNREHRLASAANVKCKRDSITLHPELMVKDDYFLFKSKRKEIAGIHSKTVHNKINNDTELKLQQDCSTLELGTDRPRTPNQDTRALSCKWGDDRDSTGLSYQDSEMELKGINWDSGSMSVPSLASSPDAVVMATQHMDSPHQMASMGIAGGNPLLHQSHQPLHSTPTPAGCKSGSECLVNGDGEVTSVDYGSCNGTTINGIGSEGHQANKSCQASLINPIRHRDPYVNIPEGLNGCPMGDEITKTNTSQSDHLSHNTDNTGSLLQEQKVYWKILTQIRENKGRLKFSKVVVDWSTVKALRAQVGDLCVLYLVSAKMCQFITPRFGWEFTRHRDVIARSPPISDVRVIDCAAEVWYKSDIRDMTEQTVEHVIQMTETLTLLKDMQCE